MKKIILISILAILFTMNTNAQKILVVYYSWGGNTRAMAQMIKERTGADIFEIVPVSAYPSEYKACTEQAKDEINRNHRPALKGKVENIGQYDVIFVGSPNWWSTIAPPVSAFLANHDLSGKTVLPFMTHEGTRLGRSVDEIKKLCPKADVLAGLPVRGGSVRDDSTRNDIDKWLRDSGVIE